MQSLLYNYTPFGIYLLFLSSSFLAPPSPTTAEQVALTSPSSLTLLAPENRISSSSPSLGRRKTKVGMERMAKAMDTSSASSMSTLQKAALCCLLLRREERDNMRLEERMERVRDGRVKKIYESVGVSKYKPTKYVSLPSPCQCPSVPQLLKHRRDRPARRAPGGRKI